MGSLGDNIKIYKCSRIDGVELSGMCEICESLKRSRKNSIVTGWGEGLNRVARRLKDSNGRNWLSSSRL